VYCEKGASGFPPGFPSDFTSPFPRTGRFLGAISEFNSLLPWNCTCTTRVISFRGPLVRDAHSRLIYVCVYIYIYIYIYIYVNIDISPTQYELNFGRGQRKREREREELVYYKLTRSLAIGER